MEDTFPVASQMSVQSSMRGGVHCCPVPVHFICCHLGLENELHRWSVVDHRLRMHVHSLCNHHRGSITQAQRLKASLHHCNKRRGTRRMVAYTTTQHATCNEYLHYPSSYPFLSVIWLPTKPRHHYETFNHSENIYISSISAELIRKGIK